jgi:hypothetical protein
MADNEDDLVDYDEEEVRAWLRQQIQNIRIYVCMDVDGIMVRECEKGEEELKNVNLPTVAVWITTYYIVERRVPSLEKDIGERFSSIWLSLSSKSVQLAYIFRTSSSLI